MNKHLVGINLKTKIREYMITDLNTTVDRLNIKVQNFL